MDILQTVKERRSIHSFKSEEVPESLLTDIFYYASYAPNHYLKEPWNIKVYQGKGKHLFIDQMMKSYQRLGMFDTGNIKKTKKMIKSMTTFLLTIPHHALIYFPIEKDPIRYEEDYAAVCAFIQNAQLVAWKFGVGMLWTITPYMHDPTFYQEIGLCHKREKIAAVMQIGYPKSIPKNRGRTPIEHKLQFIKIDCPP